jgi:hypothetical protein
MELKVNHATAQPINLPLNNEIFQQFSHRLSIRLNLHFSSLLLLHLLIHSHQLTANNSHDGTMAQDKVLQFNFLTVSAPLSFPFFVVHFTPSSVVVNEFDRCHCANARAGKTVGKWQ